MKNLSHCLRILCAVEREKENFHVEEKCDDFGRLYALAPRRDVQRRRKRAAKEETIFYALTRHLFFCY
jgi:hypothetical protein